MRINRQLLVFFSLAYGISWLIWLPLYGPALGFQTYPPLPFQHALGGFGPMLAALVATAVYQKRTGLAALAKSMLAWKPILYVLIALFGPFALNLLAAGLGALTADIPFNFSGLGVSREFPQFNFLAFFGYNLLFFGFGEETGWRGFALPRLQARYPALTASLLLSIFWAVWHLPLFLYRPGYAGMDAAGAAGWLLSLATGSVLLSWLFNSTGGSILVCAIFHATVDIAFISNFSTAQIVPYTGMLITLWGIAVVIWFRPRDLSRFPRVKTGLS